MRKRGTVLWLLLAVVAVLLAGRRHATLREIRRSHWPEAAAVALDEAPPLLAFTTVALAGFQGLIADMLWLRVSRLQDQGQFFEIVQLADWITKLEPRFTEVWAFHAWNMAYNISVMFPDPQDRWRWVQHGIRLLRDEGLRLNPADPRLYQELGWIYQHKIGGHWDDAHMTYKWELAQSMDAVLAGGRLDAERITEDAALRQRLETGYGLDPDAMLAVDRAYGPLDWRAAHTHAIYWAWRGLQVAPPDGRLPNERMLYYGLSQAFQQGNVILDQDRRMMMTSPNLDLYEVVQRAFSETLERDPDNQSVLIAYRNFLLDAVMMFFVYGRRTDAAGALDMLRAQFPDEGFDMDLDALAARELLAQMDQVSLRHAAALIEGYLYQAANYRLLRESERAEAMEALARFLWQRAADRFGGRAATAMPPLRELRRLADQRARRVGADSSP